MSKGQCFGFKNLHGPVFYLRKLQVLVFLPRCFPNLIFESTTMQPARAGWFSFEWSGLIRTWPGFSQKITCVPGLRFEIFSALDFRSKITIKSGFSKYLFRAWFLVLIASVSSCFLLLDTYCVFLGYFTSWNFVHSWLCVRMSFI